MPSPEKQEHQTDQRPADQSSARGDAEGRLSQSLDWLQPKRGFPATWFFLQTQAPPESGKATAMPKNSARGQGELVCSGILLLLFGGGGLEPVEGDPEKAHRASAGVGLFEQRQGRGRDLFGGSTRGEAGLAPGDRLESGVAQLERHRASEEIPARQRCRRLLSRPSTWERCRHIGEVLAKVSSQPIDFRDGRINGRSSSPKQGAQGLGVIANGERRAASSPSDLVNIRIPRVHPARVTGPTPQDLDGPPGETAPRAGADHGQASGFCQPEAIFARNLLGATPADAVRLVSFRILALILLATSTPSGSPQAFSDTSR